MTSFWDERYAAHPAAYGDEPNAFLASVADRLAPESEVVCLAEGQGRNALWLAGRGHRVTMVDASAVATAQARARAVAEGLSVTIVQADLAEWRPPACDAVVSIFAHLPPPVRQVSHAAAWDALRPGGLLLLEAFTPAQLARDTGGPRNPALLYTPALLRGDFPDAEVLLLAEQVVPVHEGPFHSGPADVVRLVARKPA
jgi:SAM-dependent methyltransferase